MQIARRIRPPNARTRRSAWTSARTASGSALPAASRRCSSRSPSCRTISATRGTNTNSVGAKIRRSSKSVDRSVEVASATVPPRPSVASREERPVRWLMGRYAYPTMAAASPSSAVVDASAGAAGSGRRACHIRSTMERVYIAPFGVPVLPDV